MDALHVALTIVSVVSGGLAAWFGRRVFRSQADVALHAAASARFQDEARSERERAEALAMKVDELREEANACENRAVALQKDLEAATRSHGQAIEHERQQYLLKERELSKRLEEQREHMARRDAELAERFKALAADALKGANEELLKIAKERIGAEHSKGAAQLLEAKNAVDALVKPLGEAIKRTDEQLQRIGREWASERASLAEQFRGMNEAQRGLRDETNKLVRALREPHVRGRYGELQLRRVVELAGMLEHCDFVVQDTSLDGDGQRRRPDMVMRLPNGRRVVVDSKANIHHYLRALEAGSDAEREECLDCFADAVARQAVDLAKTRYWTLAEYDGSPEFVVMFIPGDVFLDAALARRADLIEHAIANNIILATPSTLLGLLRAVSKGFQEQRLAEAAAELRDVAATVLDRAATTFDHAQKLGRALSQAVERYNDFQGSYERRLQPVLTRFAEAGVRAPKEVPELDGIDTRPRIAALADGRALVSTPRGEPAPLLLGRDGV